MTLSVGFMVWLATTLVIAALSGTRGGAGGGLAVAGVSLLVPFAVAADPFAQLFLAIAMIWVFLRAADLSFADRPGSFWSRLLHLVSVVDISRVTRRTRCLDLSVAGRLAIAAAATTCVAGVLMATAGKTEWFWHPVRWISVGLGTYFAFELTGALLGVLAGFCGLALPLVNDEPYRSRSLSEFWSKRWNLVFSRVLRDVCFKPLARTSPAGALLVSFMLSAFIHAYVMAVALGAMAAVFWAAFFLVQPIFIALERRLRVRFWADWARRAWTVAILLVLLPLFAEPLCGSRDK